MVAPTKPTQPSPHASRNSPSTFPALADATMQYALIDGPDYVEATADFSEIQAAIAEAAAQDLLTSFTDFSGDVDGLTSNGIYKLATGVTNAWSGAGDNDFLFNLYYDATNQTQFGYEGGAYTHLRSKVGGVWGSWGPTYKIATQPEAVAGTDDTNAMTALKTRQSFNATGSAPVYACRAWVNFDGSGTLSISDSANVSGVTDLGTGSYRVLIDVDTSGADYAFMVTSNNYGQAVDGTLLISQADVVTKDFSGAPTDASLVSVAIIGD